MEKKIKRVSRIKENSSDMFLRKHVGLIHCENKLTLIQRKIANILLFNALEKINEVDIHDISLRELCSMVGYKSNDTQLIKDAIKSLISTVMEWNLLSDKKFKMEDSYSKGALAWNASSLLAGASIYDGMVSYSYSPQMKSVLSNLEIYGRINLFIQSKFKSTYSLVLYENCIRFKNLKQTKKFPLDLFRALMGVSVDKYSSFKEFQRNVIKVAVAEINLKADIHIEPVFIKRGRSIDSVQFMLSENENYKPTFKKIMQVETGAEKLIIKESIFMETLLKDFQISPKKSAELISLFPEDYLAEKIALVKSKRNISNVSAYLISALKDDYKESKQFSLNVEQPSTLCTSREVKEPQKIQYLRNKYVSYKTSIYIEYLDKQAEHTQKEIHDRFEISLKQQYLLHQKYKKSGLTSPFVAQEFIRFIDDNFSEVIGNYLQFDDFICSEEGELNIA